MKRLLLISLLLPTLAAAQVTNAPEPARAPATKLEAFSARGGFVMIKGFSSVGTVFGQGKVSVDAREFRDASNTKQAEYGIIIEVKEPGRLEREGRSFVDYDEIDSLVRGIDYISKIDKNVTAMNQFEAEYRTKGDFAVTVFSQQSGELGLAVSSGRVGKVTAFLKIRDLEQLKGLVVDAKKSIDSAKSGK